MRRYSLLLLIVLIVPRWTAAQDGTDRIRVNQIGFYPGAPKEAVVVDAPDGAFYVTTPGGADTVFTGTLGGERYWDASGETVRQADFSTLQQPGSYVLAVPAVGTSHPFEVRPAVHQAVATAALKGFYFQRASLPLDPAHADRWARPAGHPDDAVRVHASAATEERPTGTVIAAPRGWYDAGDYNKYIVNSGISTYTLLALYEHYPAYVETLATAIPESGDAVPDVLDEALWNLRWMLAMQDPHDGGVYHKLTHTNFSGAVMPHEATAPRYVVQKSTAATLDFAAVAAQAARVFDAFPETFPNLADTLRTAALDAWRWARKNPQMIYDQKALNRSYDPDIQTGAYGDGTLDDEWAWAAAELYVTTQADSFLAAASPLEEAAPTVPSWGSVRSLGWYTLLHHHRELGTAVDTTVLQQRFLQWAEGLADRRGGAPYGVVMGQETGDFVWGSNAVAANQGMALLQAFRLTRDSTYLWAALSNLDYLLGRNATAYSFVTGYGDRTPMHPHHRPSEADGIAEPVPGLLAGGPNPGQQDGCAYPSDRPARSYTDVWCSYASNEIAINWNAPLVYLAAALEAELSAEGQPMNSQPEERGALPGPVRLLPPYPNPAENETTLAFELDEAGEVGLEAYDVLGRRVAAWHWQPYAPGRHSLTWQLDTLSQGLYVIRLMTVGQTQAWAVLKEGS